MPLREGTPSREYLTPGEDRTSYGGIVEHDKGVEGVIEYMAAHDEKLETAEKKEMNDLLDTLSNVLDQLRFEDDPVKLAQLEQSRTDIETRLEGDSKFSEQVEKEMSGSIARVDSLEREMIFSERVASLEKKNQPEDPYTEQAKIAEKLYRDLMFGMDQIVSIDKIMQSLKGNGVESAAIMVGSDEPEKSRTASENVESRFARIKDERRTIIGELGAFKDIFKHPEQFSVAQLDDWQTRVWKVFEDLLLLKRQLEHEASKLIKRRDIKTPSTNK